MHAFAGWQAAAARARITILFLVTILVLGVLPNVALGQVDVTEPNLHDAEVVYGVEAAGPGSYVNSQGISLLALGETDPLLYADASFYAYGLFCNVADVNLVNSGAIDVNAVGGNTTANDGADADVYAYGIRGVRDVNNIGDILVAVLGGTVNVPASVADVWTDGDAYVYAYGIDADGDVNNTGVVTVTVAGGTATVSADANDTYANADANTDIDAYGIDAGGDVDNAGAITVTAAGGTATTSLVDANDTYVNADADADVDAYGIDADGDVNNTGAVVVTATGGTATASAVADANDNYVDADADADAYASGLEAWGAVTNTGAITLTATGGTASTTVSASTSTSSDVEAYTDAGAYGIDSGDAVTNTGAITVTATAGTAGAETYGDVDADSDADAWVAGIYADGDVNNTGAIVSTATGGVATADANDASARAYASAGALGIEAGGAVTNTGNIAVTATGGTATASTGADGASARAIAIAEAAGIYAEGALTNTGDVTVTVTGGVATADEANADAYVYAIYAGSDVNNAGDVTAIATTEEGATAYAYGFYLDGTGTLTNTGTIRVTGDETYEVYIASGTTTLGETYNVTLDGDPNDAAFYISDGATLALNDATLTVTSVADETRWDTEYQLFEINETGVVDGNFVSVEAINPDTVASYHTQGTSAAVDDTVSLAYSPEASEPTGAAAVEKHLVSQSIDLVNHRMTGTLLQSILSPGTSGLLADAGPVSQSLGLGQSGSGSTSGVFVEPYYSRMEHDANPLGYDADLWGFAAGYERQMDATLVSFHAGYGQADVDYTGAGYSANSEDQDLLTAGFSGLTRWSEWTLRYGLTGFYGWHDYQGRTGLNLAETETGETDSYGVVASAMVGRILRKDSHVFLPEAGLTYLWGHRQRYTTDASNAAWDTTYSAMDDHDLQAVAALHWLCGFMHDDIHVTPSASIGVRHLLTDAESTVTQSVPGATPVSVTSERDRTAMTLSGSVILRQRRHSLSLAYDGEYSPDTERHSLWLRYGWQF